MIKNNWLDDHTARAYLIAGKTYTVAMQSSDANEFDVQINPEKKVLQAEVALTDKEYIAGMDYIFGDDILIDVTLENGDMISASGDGLFADGSGFYYEIINVETGEKVDLNDASENAGTYEITAIQQVGKYRTGGVIYQTNDSIYSSGSTIMFEPVKSNTVTVTVKNVNADTLTVIEEEKDIILKANASRQLFSFTPSKTALYELRSEGDMAWAFYETGKTGLNKVGNTLTAGKAYVLMIYKVPFVQTVCVTSDFSHIRHMQDKETLNIELSAYGSETVIFTPEITGEYIIAGQCVSGDAAYSVYTSDYVHLISNEYGELSNVIRDIEAGTTYQIKFYNESPADAVFEVSVMQRQEKEAESLSVTVKDTANLSAEFASEYDVNDLFEITVEYADGTSEVVPANSHASTGVEVYAQFWDSYNLNESVVRYEYRIVYGAGSDDLIYVYATVDFKRTQNAYIELAQDVPASVRIGDQGVRNRTFVSFIPEADGEYYFECKDGYGIYDLKTGKPGTTARRFSLLAGQKYQFCIEAWTGSVRGEELQVTVSRCKDVTKLELLTEPDPFIYGLSNVGTGMSAKATFADGTTAVVGSDYGCVNGYSSVCEIYTVKSGVYRVSLKYGGRRVSCLVNELDLESLVKLDMSQMIDVETEQRTPVYAVFTPEFSGNYDLDIRFDGTLEENYGYFDMTNRSNAGTPAKLTAGKTYVVRIFPHNEEDGKIQLRPVYLDSTCEYGNHAFTAFVYNQDATCESDGTETALCSYGCGMSNTQIAHGTATGHNYTQYISQAATCERNGLKTFTCTRKCGLTDAVYTEIIPKAAHVIVDIPSKAATCTETGLTEGKKCSVCNAVTKAQTTMKAKGHVWNAWTETEATVFSEGNKMHKCTVCQTIESVKTAEKLEPTIKLTAGKIILKTKQSTKNFKVTGLAVGDSIASMKLEKNKSVKISAVNFEDGTCKLTARGKTGKAKLTITLASGLQRTVNITVQKSAVKATSIKVESKKIALKVKQKLTLKPEVQPFTCTDKITYKSSNKKIVTVSNKGVLKGIKAGKAKITIQAGKKKVTVNVTVNKK